VPRQLVAYMATFGTLLACFSAWSVIIIYLRSLLCWKRINEYEYEVLDWEVILHLNFTIKSSLLMKSIIEREATFENNQCEHKYQ